MNNKALGIIFSNIHDKDLAPLTNSRTIGSIPIGGRFRLIDFALSNMAHAGVKNVGVVTKENYQSLLAHIGSGKAYNLAKKSGGLVLLPPFANAQKTLYQTRLDALISIEHFIAKATEPYVILTDCDSVNNIDYSFYLSGHIKSGADISVLEYLDKDKKAQLANITIASRSALLSSISLAKAKNLTSFSKDILQNTKALKINKIQLLEKFILIDSLASYYNAALSLLCEKTRDSIFYNINRAIFTKVEDTCPVKISKQGTAINSLIADGCTIEGHVENSILSRGCFVAKGAIVKNSILLQNTTVGKNSKLNYIICDNDVAISNNVTLSSHITHPQYIYKQTVI